MLKTLKNFILLSFVKLFNIFSKKNSYKQDSPRFLILSTTGLGDTLWATPAIKALKMQFKNAYLAVLTTRFGKEVLKNSPYIDDIFIFNRLFSFRTLSLWRKLKKKKIQIIFHFHTSQRIVLPFAATIGAEKIIGYLGKTKGLDKILTDSFKETKLHEIEKRLQLLNALEISAKISPPECFLLKSIQEEKRKEKWILLHPGAKDGYKCWPLESYLDLAELYKKTYNAKIFFSVGPSDKELLKKIENASNDTIIKNLKLKDFANTLSKMDLVITNDTGPMHLACALKVPTVAIFSPTNPDECGPIADLVEVINVQRTCSPCILRKCRDPFCFYQIGPKDVFERSRNFLEK